jgi:hypothetical protein
MRYQKILSDVVEFYSFNIYNLVCLQFLRYENMQYCCCTSTIRYLPYTRFSAMARVGHSLSVDAGSVLFCVGGAPALCCPINDSQPTNRL